MTTKTTQRVGFIVDQEVKGPYMQAAAETFYDKRQTPVLTGISTRRGPTNLLANTNSELRASEENV